MGEGDGDVGEDGGGVGVDRGDDDGPGSVPAPPEARGREAPFLFFFLDLLPKWEKGFPSGPWLPWLGRGREPLRAWICLSVSLCFCVLLVLPFHRFVYIWRSVTLTGLKPSPRFFPEN